MLQETVEPGHSYVRAYLLRAIDDLAERTAEIVNTDMIGQEPLTDGSLMGTPEYRICLV